MDVLQLLDKATESKASDLHITVNLPAILRVDGELVKITDQPFTPEETSKLVRQILSEKQISVLEAKGEVDLSFTHPGRGRFRVNAYKQRNSYGMALRVVSSIIPSLQELGLPPVVAELSRKKRGLILVTGPTGSGKSTTLASMIDLMNDERNAHVVTLEDPIEYLHSHRKCMINQREVGGDTQNFANGLRASLRQDPDVILVGEMRDLETISIAVTAAETGHLVLSTLHTLGAASTIDRIIDAFPPYQQEQIKIQLSGNLQGIISQQLMIRKNGIGRVGAFEVMTATNAVRNLVREGKTNQIQSAIQTGSKYGMQTMDNALLSLYRQGEISRDTILTYSMDQDYVRKQLGLMS